jgi:Lysylphosphatidylglycerol synthase TM region
MELADKITRTDPQRRQRLTPLGAIVAAAAALLFIYLVKKAGPAQVIAGIRSLGVGFVLVLAISSVRHVVRSIAWVLCLEPPYRLRFWDALRARLMGDAIGNVLPFANFIVSEPAKPALIRDRLPLMAGFSSIVVENGFYSISVVVFIACGMLAVLLTFSEARVFRLVSLITLAVIAVVAASGFILIQKQIRISRALALVPQKHLKQKWLASAQTLEDRVYGFYRRNSARFFPILLLEACFHLAGIIEIYATLLFISPQRPPTLFNAFILESVNRLITMVFKFVPLRMGVDEAGTGKVSQILQFSEAAGVTLAIIRKARDLCWALVGVALLIHRQILLRKSAAAGESVEGATVTSHVETADHIG